MSATPIPVNAAESTKRALMLLRSPSGVTDPAIEVPPPDKSAYHEETKGVDTFLEPRLPGRFNPYEVKRMPNLKRQARFLQAYAASMGNLSLARYFVLWSPAEYRALLKADPVFAQAVEDAEEEIADRAKLILYSDLGLIENLEVPQSTRKVASAVLSRIVEGLHARKEDLPVAGHRKPQAQRRVRFKP